MTTMDSADTQREATATIRGYIYQFDASILAVLSAKPGEKVTVEGVEDFDLLSGNTETYGQVKYYEAQKLTDARLRDAILPMIAGFLRFPPEQRERKRYMLYGYFKQAPEEPPAIELTDLQRILVYRPFTVDTGTGEKVRTEVNLQAKIGASNADLADFSKRFSVQLSEPFEEHRARVIAALQTALNLSKVEAEGYCYPSALTAMAGLSSAAIKRDRTTTKDDFLQKIGPKIAIYSAWALREEGENEYCRKIRQLHFTRLNIDNQDRFFVISLPVTGGIDDLRGLIQHIIGRWSSHKVNRKPAKERCAPFFFFPGMAADVLAVLKNWLVDEGHKITDGYAFCGAKFSTEHLMLPQTKEYPISARFVSTCEQFNDALSGAKYARLVIQLHAGDPLDISPEIQQISVPINSASMAKKIV